MLNHFIEDNQYFIRVQTFTNDYSRKETIKNRLRLFRGTSLFCHPMAPWLIEIINFKTAAPIP